MVLLINASVLLIQNLLCFMQDLLEAVKPVLEEEQLQDAVDSLLMESSSYDAKIMYNAMKVWKHELHANQHGSSVK